MGREGRKKRNGYHWLSFGYHFGVAERRNWGVFFALGLQEGAECGGMGVKGAEMAL